MRNLNDEGCGSIETWQTQMGRRENWRLAESYTLLDGSKSFQVGEGKTSKLKGLIAPLRLPLGKAI
jgi:hypothetical protein